MARSAQSAGRLCKTAPLMRKPTARPTTRVSGVYHLAAGSNVLRASDVQVRNASTKARKAALG
ncbi:hypothetical protein OCOJLMKI_3363 [Methylobacterium iners]|uniref:Uncharacterized protein n=1 Tax=Methylobacterium iners TaxID=418707 RepID=A0ABQ4S0I6_9HYPH|nr:hypothetical protein OCOJLMKI_3363 [Methylobacterium iners]